MNFNTEAFMNTLPIIGKGMLGIFIVTGVIILSMYLLRVFTADKDEGKK